MIADAELLARYADQRTEAAFAELVQRHLGLVYSAALRQVHGDTHLAQDVAQLVFTDLARKAGQLRHHAVLTGWLYTSTRYAALQAIRSARRRQRREQEAQHMHDVSLPTASAVEWQRLQPVLDEVMHDLGERDREAVLLRFFENLPFADIGARLGLSEDAARKRVHRALDALRAALGRRGIISTGTALGLVLAERAVAAAPAALGGAIAHAAVAGAAATAGASVSFWPAFAGAKLLGGAAAALVVGGTVAGLWQYRTAQALRTESAALAEENVRLAAPLAPAGQPAQLAALEEQIATARAATAEAEKAFALRAAAARAATPRAAADAPSASRVDPARARLLRRTALDRSHATFFRRVALPPAQLEQLIGLLLDRGTAGADREALEAQIARLLGPEKFAYYQRYEATLPLRYQVSALGDQLRFSATPFTDAQLDAIVFAAAEHPVAASGETGASRFAISDAAVEQVAPQLAPEQLAALRGAQAARQAMAAMMELNRTAAVEGRLMLAAQSLKDYPPPPGSPADRQPPPDRFSGVKATPASLVRVDFKDFNALDALALYARLAGKTLVVAPEVEGARRTVTVAFQDLSPAAAAMVLRGALLQAGIDLAPESDTRERVTLRGPKPPAS
jgi:RNA polymerase sigma factor (sigma-70 family)